MLWCTCFRRILMVCMSLLQTLFSAHVIAWHIWWHWLSRHISTSANQPQCSVMAIIMTSVVLTTNVDHRSKRSQFIQCCPWLQTVSSPWPLDTAGDSLPWRRLVVTTQNWNDWHLLQKGLLSKLLRDFTASQLLWVQWVCKWHAAQWTAAADLLALCCQSPVYVVSFSTML